MDYVFFFFLISNYVWSKYLMNITSYKLLDKSSLIVNNNKI